MSAPEGTLQRPTLGSLGQVYVTGRVAIDYGRAVGLEVETARRQLTELLLDARLSGEAEEESGRPATFRRRSRTVGVDLIACVSHEPPLLVVVSITVRRLAARRP